MRSQSYLNIMLSLALASLPYAPRTAYADCTPTAKSIVDKCQQAVTEAGNDSAHVSDSPYEDS